MQAVGEQSGQHNRHEYEEELDHCRFEVLEIDVLLGQVGLVSVGLREHVQVGEQVGGEIQAEANL